MISPSNLSATDLRSRLDRALGVRDSIRSSVKKTEAEVRRLKNEDEVLALTGKLLRTLMDMQVTDAKQVVEKLLTEGLQNVFADQDLHVRAEVDEQRGKVAMNLITVEKHSDGKVTEGVAEDSNGGAVTTVQSVLMRIITTMKRDQRRILALDEALPAFNANYLVDMMTFLRQICDRLGFDIIMVTQNRSLISYASRAYNLRKFEGRALIEDLK